MALKLFIVLMTCTALVVECSHFRGGIVQWSPVNSFSFDGQIVINHRIAWRRTSSGNYCDASTISQRTLIGSGSLQCRSGCSGTVASLSYYCTDFSTVDDWSSGEKTSTFNIGSVTYFEASYTGCCWISTLVVGADSSWEIRVKGQLTPRSDNGQINSSPVSATTPIVRLQRGCTRVINLPVQDADGDNIRCRWASGNECSGICGGFSYGILSGCSLTYNGGGSAGLYAVALQIEDFISTSSITPLSSVPLQFIVEVFSSSQPCDGTRPSLVGETLPAGSCIPVPFGTTFRTSVVAMVAHSSVSIVDFPTVSPLGTTKSSISQSIHNPLLYYTNITWTPQVSQYGLNILCYTARDSNSLTSDQYCITLLGGVQGPMALQNTTSPTGAIVATGPITFSVEFDQEIGRPTRSSYIRIYESSGVQALAIDASSSSVVFPPSGSQGTVLTFTVSYSFQAADEYYILLDTGVTVGSAFCSQESLPIQNSSFWRFSTGVDECALGTDDCSQYAICTDTDSSYYCTCSQGFTGDGRTCSDIDECLSLNICPLYSSCTNTIGNFSCSCLFGVASDGVSCRVPPNPDPPVSLLVINIGTTYAAVTWNAPPQLTNNRVVSFLLTLTERRFGLPSINITVPLSQLSYPFTNLEEFDTYDCAIVSVSEYGFYSTAASISFTTLAAAPSASPINPGGEAVSSSLIRIYWTRPSEIEINGAVLFYLVELREVLTGKNFTFHAVDDEIIVGPLHAYYEYLCRIAIYTTSLGPFTSYFSVFSGEAIPSSPPVSVVVTGTTSSTVSLSWNPPPLDEQNGVIRYYVVYITQIGGSGGTSQLQANTTMLTVQNLLPIYSYDISIAAYTIGLGPSTLVLSVSLPESAPSAPPTNLNGFALDHTSIYFEWEPPPLHQQNGIVVQYVVNITERETGLMFQRITTQTSITLSSLHPDYIYECRVSAVTIGEGPFSAVFAIRVLVAAPSSPPVNVVTVFPDPYSIEVSWEPPPPEDRNGPIIGYVINVTVVATGEVLQFSTNVSQFSLTSLQPFSTFVCVYAALTPVGIGPFSVQYIVTTPEDIPSPPLAPSVLVPIDPNSLYISWAEPAIPNGIVSVYTVYCEKSDTSTVGSGDSNPLNPYTDSPPSSSDDLSNETVSASTNSTSFTLTGLTPYTQYNCFVSASTSAGESDFSTVISAVTEESVPGDAPMFATSNPTASTVFIMWEAPTVPNGVIVSYTVSYNLTSRNVTVVVDASFGTQYTISGLDAYTYYECLITAETKVGSGPAGSVIIRTAESSPDSPPTNILPSVMSSTAVSTTWLLPPEEDRNGVIIYYILLLRDVQFNTSDTTINVSGLTYIYTNLHEYTQYSLEIAAATSVGVGPFSSSILFTTHEDVPTAPPQRISGIARSSTLVTFMWAPPPPLEVNGLLRYYIVEVTERHTSRSWTFFAVDNDIHIGSLHPYYYYDCVVAAYTISTGPFSQTLSVLTDQDVPTAPPEQLSAIETADSLTLMWNPPPFEQTNGVIQYYALAVTELDTGQVYTSTSESVVTVVNNLHPYYSYQCVIAAYTVGLGPYSDAITVQLNEKAPSGPPTNIIGQPTSSESIYVSWNPPLFNEQNGMIRSYVLNVMEIETGVNTTHSVLITSSTLFSLHPFYNYEITVSAVTVGVGPSSQAIIIQTNADVPSSPVQDPTASSFTMDTVMLTWRAPTPEDRNGIIIGYKINVTVVASGTTFELTSTIESISVTSLRPYTSYVFRIAAVTVVGTGPFSTALSVTTRQAAPESSPEDVVLSAVSSTSIIVSWSPPPTQFQNGVITEYRINITELDTGSDFLYTTATTTILIQLLHPFYTYECTVSAYTVDEGPYSEIITITTPEDVPSGYPQNFAGHASTSRSALLTWDPPPEEQQNGIIVNYTVDISVADTGQTFQVDTNATRLTLSTLLPYRTYFCTISASTIVGQGPPSTVFTLTTPEDAPSGSPTVTSYSAQDSTTIIYSWNAPAADQQNGIIREYRIQVLEVETGNVSLYVSFSTSIEISSLHPDYTYVLSVSAFTVAAGPYSSTVNITTPEDVPSGPPQKISQVSVTSTVIRLIWELPLPENQNGDIIGYSVEISALEISETNVHFVVGEELELTGLRPFTTYSVVIAAQTAIGIGPYSRIFHVQTLEDAPSSQPSNLNGYAVNATHIFLQWEPPPENATNGIIREYRINITEILTGAMLYYTTDPDTRELLFGPLHPFYTYQCVIVAHTIEPGPFTEAIFIQTEEAAPSGPPRNVTLRVENSRSISLSWNPPPLTEQNGILRQYTVTVVSSVSTDRHIVSSSSSSVVITGLMPFTTYTCSVQAVTIGSGPESDMIQITMPEDVPTGPPKLIVAAAVSPTILRINWEPPNVEHRNGVLRRYIINVTELETMYHEIFYTEVKNITLTSRHPFYLYRYTIAAETIDFGPFSSSDVIQMPEAAPSASPTGISTRNVTSTSFQLMWSEPPPDAHNGVIRNYEVVLTDQNTGIMSQITTQRTDVQFENLNPFTSYSYQLRAVTISPGPLSNAQLVRTLEDVPAAAPQNFSAQVLSSTSILLRWGDISPEARNGLILGYQVTITQPDAGTTINISTSSDANDLLVEELARFTSYTCSVLAFTAVGNGPVSQSVTITTLEDAPDGAPASVMSTDVTSTTITLSWSSPSDDLHNGLIRHFLINVIETNTGVNYTIQTLARTTFTIGDLHPYYTYKLSVQAVTVLPGPPSLSVTVLTLQDVPAAAPVSIEVFPLDSTTLQIEWDDPSIEFHNGLILDYSVNISEAETGRSFQLASGGLRSIVIPGLHPFYTYTFVVAASTIVGRGPYTTSHSIQMPEDAPTSYPLGLTGDVVNSTAVLLHWQHPETQGRNGIITYYDVMLTELFTGRVLEYTRVGSHVDILITSLHPYFEYECIVAARTSVGRGPFSPVIRVQTDEDVPSGPPLNANVTAVDSGTAYLTWRPPSPEHVNGIIRLYSVRVENMVTGDSSLLNTTAEFLTVSSLHPFYTYSFSVAGYTTGVGVYSEELIVILPEDVPSGEPLNVQAVSVSSTSIRISWEPPRADQQNGLITAYHITVLEMETGNLLTFTTTVTDNLLIVNSLHPFYNYDCSVAAYTIGLGPATMISVQTLPEEPSDVPQNISVSALSPTNALLSWMPPLREHQNGIITGYIVRVSGVNSDEEQELSVTELSIVISRLHPFYSYRFSVAAETIAPGPFNNPLTLKMPESVPTASPTNLTLIDVTATSATVGWYPPDPSSWNGLLTHYIINYQLIRSREETMGSSTNPQLSFVIPSFGQPLVNELDPTRIDSSLLMETARVNGLEEYYVYQFSVYYETTVGRSPSSTSLLLETLPAVPSGPPAMVQAAISSSLSSSLVVEWMPPEIRHRNGLITGYSVILTNRETAEQLMYNVQVLNLHVEGLPSYTDFEVSVSALSESGSGPYSSPVLIKTSESKPGRPRSVTVKIENSTAVSLSWVQPEIPNGEIIEYQVIFKPLAKSNVDIVDGPYTLSLMNTTELGSIVIGELRAGLTYEFLVRARTSAGYGANSTAVTVEIPEPELQPVDSISPGLQAAIIVATVGWILIVIILVVGIAIYIRRKSKVGKFSLSNRRSTDTHVYEVPNIVAVNTGASENNFDEMKSDSFEEHKMNLASDEGEDDTSSL